MIVSFLGLKGGQGKSSLSVRLGAWLAAVGHRVLLVDLSPAGSASLLLGHGLVPDSGSGALLGGEAEPRQAIRTTDCPKLDLAPSDATLEGFPPASEALRQLKAAAKPYDFTLLDAPTGWDGVALLALAAGDWAVLPVTPDEAGVSGLRRTLDWMRDSRSRFRKRAALAGVALNAVDPRSRTQARVVRSLRRSLGGELFKTAVRRDPRWRDPGSLAGCWKRPKKPVGADRDAVALRRELLGQILTRS